MKLALGDREADAHVAAMLVPEARVDADVDRLAGVGEGPDPAPDVDLLAAIESDGVDRADHPPLGLLDVGGDRGLAERLGNELLEERVAGLHPAPPLGDDREPEAAGVLVELADQRVHPRPRRRSARPGCRAKRGFRRRAGCGGRCRRGPSRAARRSRRRRISSAPRRARHSAAPTPGPPRPSPGPAAARDRRWPRSRDRRASPPPRSAPARAGCRERGRRRPGPRRPRARGRAFSGRSPSTPTTAPLMIAVRNGWSGP